MDTTRRSAETLVSLWKVEIMVKNKKIMVTLLLLDRPPSHFCWVASGWSLLRSGPQFPLWTLSPQEPFSYWLVTQSLDCLHHRQTALMIRKTKSVLKKNSPIFQKSKLPDRPSASWCWDF